MNKKGFTLTELLGVIVILSLLTLISGVAITNIVKDSKKELTDTQKEAVLYAAQLWAEDNLESLTNAGCVQKTKSQLEREGYINNTLNTYKYNRETGWFSGVEICVSIDSESETPILTYRIIS